MERIVILVALGMISIFPSGALADAINPVFPANICWPSLRDWNNSAGGMAADPHGPPSVTARGCFSTAEQNASALAADPAYQIQVKNLSPDAELCGFSYSLVTSGGPGTMVPMPAGFRGESYVFMRYTTPSRVAACEQTPGCLDPCGSAMFSDEGFLMPWYFCPAGYVKSVTSQAPYYICAKSPKIYVNTSTGRPKAVAKDRGKRKDRCVGNPCDPVTGNKYQIEVDFPGSETVSELKLERHYNSSPIEDGTVRGSTVESPFLSDHWTHTYHRFVVSEIPGTPANQAVFTPIVRAYREDGRVLTFAKVDANGIPSNSGTWKGDSDVLEQIAPIEVGGVISGWRFVTENDDVEIYDVSGRLLTIADRNGVTVSLAYSNGRLSQVTDAWGRSLTFTYTSGRLTSVSLPNGTQIEYAYDLSKKNLAGVRWTKASNLWSKNYHYEDPVPGNSHALTGISDENGVRFSTYNYYSNGRISSEEHAPLTSQGVNRHQFEYTIDSNGVQMTTKVTYPLGAIRYFLGSGQYFPTDPNASLGAPVLTEISGDPCPECGPKSRTYDVYGFVSSTTDWNNNRTCQKHSARGLMEVQAEVGSSTCPADVATWTPSAQTGQNVVQRKTTTQWHANFRLPVKVAQPKRITEYVYNGDSGADCGRRADNALVPGVLCSVSEWATTDETGGAGLAATKIVSAADGSPRTWTYTYNAWGRVLAANGPRSGVNDVTAYEYYGPAETCTTSQSDGTALGCRGQLKKTTNAVGHVTWINRYDGGGRPEEIVDPNGLTTTLVYDARQRLTSRRVGSSGSTGELTSYEYWPNGLVKRITFPGGYPYYDLVYDDAQRLKKIGEWNGTAMSWYEYTLDAAGNRIGEYSQPGSVKLSREYNALNRLWKSIGEIPQELTTVEQHDGSGNPLRVNGPLASSGGAPDPDVRRHEWDALGRLVRSLEVLGSTEKTLSETQYDGQGQIRQIKDGLALATTYSVNGLGNTRSETSPDTGTTTREFDPAGNVTRIQDARSVVTTITYDALDRALVVTAGTGATGVIVTHIYDQIAADNAHARGRLTTLSQQLTENSVARTATLSWKYDQHGRITRRSQAITGGPTLGLNYQYYAGSGKPSEVLYPSGRRVELIYGHDGRVQNLKIDSATHARPQFHAFGGPMHTIRWGGTASSYYSWASHTWDMNRRAISYYRYLQLDATTAMPLQAMLYPRDRAGRLEGFVDPWRPVALGAFQYDNRDRVTRWTSPSTTWNFAYDDNGNRTSRGVGGNPATTYSYFSGTNKLKTVSDRPGGDFGYTAAGHITNDRSFDYDYDARGRMIKARQGSTTLATYAHNGLGERISKTVGSTRTYFLYDEQGRLAGEYTAAGAPLSEYVYVEDRLAIIMRPEGSSTRFFYVETDGTGTPRDIHDSWDHGGWLVWEWWETEPFGSSQPVGYVTSTGQPPVFTTNLRYPGQYYDAETGRHYNYFRDYDPNTGRYQQSDPIGLTAGLNTFAYVASNPINSIDPYGLADLNTFSYGDRLRPFGHAWSVEGVFTVTGHGNPRSMMDGSRPILANELAKRIRAHVKFKGQPVMLGSCNTGRRADDGSGPFAQQLANALGVPVTAPLEYAWYNSKGLMGSSSLNAPPRDGNPGTWQTFYPVGSQ